MKIRKLALAATLAAVGLSSAVTAYAQAKEQFRIRADWGAPGDAPGRRRP